MSKRGFLKHVYLAALLGAALQMAIAAPVLAQDGCIGGDRVREVTQWGNPATTFSPQPIRTLGELKDAVTKYENDIREVFRLAAWPGNPDDFFVAVRSAEEGGSTVTVREVPVGTEFEWMAFRRRGKPACVKRIQWQGREAFKGWNIVVVSNGMEYSFTVPQRCLNLAFERGRVKPLAAPTCSLSASFDPESDRITVTGSSDAADFKITAVSTPAGAGELSGVMSAGSGKWTYQPSADGTYTFTATATGKGGTTTCTAKVEVVRKKPVCSLSASVDPATHVVTLSGSGSVGQMEITGVTLHDGSPGNVADVQAAGSMGWTYDAAPTLPKKPGDYSYGFQAVSRLHGKEATCSATAVVTKEPREVRWILRGFGAQFDTTGDNVLTVRQVEIPLGFAAASGFRSAGAAALQVSEEREQFGIENGGGLGFAVEYMVNRRVGVDLDVILAEIDTNLMYDIDDAWGMDDQNMDIRPLSLGVNFHLTPGRRFDLFVGPFVSLVQYGDVTHRALGRTFRNDPDDDTAFGAKIGVDIPFGWESPWALTLGARYISTSVDAQSFSLDVDPMIGIVGFAYRF